VPVRWEGKFLPPTPILSRGRKKGTTVDELAGQLRAALEAYIEESVHEGTLIGPLEDVVRDFSLWVQEGGHIVPPEPEPPASIWWART
jgi:hypothetical protein